MNSFNEATARLNDPSVSKIEDTNSKIDFKIAKAYSQFSSWRKVPIKERSRVVERLAENIFSNREKLALVITREMGKPISQSRQEIKKCEDLCKYYAKRAPSFLRSFDLKTGKRINTIKHEPLGVLFGIMPWNFPFWQSFRFSIPSILSGNTILLKLARNVPGCALSIKSIFEKSNFPEGTFEILFSNYMKSEKIIRDNRIKGLSFTGSSFAGRKLGRVSGENLKKTVLELGGSDPYIVLKDANIEEAAKICLDSRLTNSGQSCISAKRFIVEKDVYQDFIHCFVSLCKEVKIGNPFLDKTEVGPLAKESVRKNLDRQVVSSLQLGAKNAFTSNVDLLDGLYYPITVLVDVPEKTPVFEEETFGPVAAIKSVTSPEEATSLANKSTFGLGAAIFTSDEKKAMNMASDLECGMCAINTSVKSHWELPFGGVKNSGFGKELGAEGIKSFINEKVIMRPSKAI